MKDRAWFLYPVLAVVATLVYFASGHNSYIFNVIGLSSPILILVAVMVRKPAKKLPWVLFAIGQFLFIAGDVVSYNYEKFAQVWPGIFKLGPKGSIPFPSLYDALYLSVYIFLIAGVLILIHTRHPGRDRESLVDALMLSIGLGTVSWVLLVSPNVSQKAPLIQNAVSMGYPILDLLLLAATIRLAMGAGRKPAAFWLMVGAVVSLFVTDAIYGWMWLNLPDGYPPGSGFLEIGWMAFYVLFGAAALHPSMNKLSEPAPEGETKLTRGRLVVLASASLVAPLMLAQQLAEHHRKDFSVLIGATIVLFVLVVIRMWGLMRKQQEFVTREKALREAGTNLVTATNRDSIHAATAAAVRALAGREAVVRLCEEQDDEDEGFLVVAALGGDESVVDTSLPVTALQQWKRDRLRERRSFQVKMHESTLREPLALPAAHAAVFVAPLFMRDELRGILVASVPENLPRQVADSLEALSTQAALALESAALTEDLLIQQSQARFASLVKNSSDVVMVIDPDTTIRYASPSASKVFGSAPEQMEGVRFADLITQEDRTRALSFLTSMAEDEGHTGLSEFRITHRDGADRYVETLRTNLLHDPGVKGIVLNTRDISERKEFEEQLSHQAFHDSITGLANRALFRDRVTHALERQTRDDKPVSVLFMDLDDFKTINDSLGHAAGDELLRQISTRLVSRLRAADTAARLGGDEFAVLLEDGGDEGLTAADVAQRVLEGLEEPFQLDGTEVFARASIGISIAEPGDVIESAEDLLRNADVAMYMAKENGKARYQLFEPAMHDTALKRLELKASLQRAIEHDEFQLFYQPVIELDTGRIQGVEALIRWFHPDKGLVPPLDFIPLAEETGLIVPIGRWVLNEACRYAAELQATFRHDPPLHMAVNLSARQLARPEIVDEVRDILAKTGLDPSTLVLEITESVMIQDMELAISRLSDLKGLGVLLAIDDFGTGYSSLNYVRRFPVDILKVDKSFIDGVTEGGESSALTAAVIELAGILNLKPVAEGIERADQLERLLDMHCDLGQGFLFAKPLQHGDLEAMLTERSQMQAEAAALSQPAE